MADAKLKLVIEAQDRASKEMSKLSGSVSGMMTSFGKLTGAFFAADLAASALKGTFSWVKDKIVELTRATIDYTKEAIKTAGKNEMYATSMKVMAKNVGITDEQLSGLLKTMVQEGKSLTNSNEIIRKLIVTELDLADAEKVLNAGRSAGVYAAVDSAKATMDIMDAIVRLEPEMLSMYGIEFNLNDIYEKTATSLGKKVKNLTSVEKRTAFLTAILQDQEKQIGTYEAAMGTWYKKWGSISSFLSGDLKTILGQTLSGGLNPLMEGVYNNVTALAAWAFGIDKGNTDLTKLSGGLGELKTSFGELFTGIWNVISSFLGLGDSSFKALTGVNKLADGTTDWTKVSEDLTKVPLVKFVNDFSSKLAKFIDEHKDTIINWVSNALKFFKAIKDWIYGTGVPMFNRLKEIITNVFNRYIKPAIADAKAYWEKLEEAWTRPEVQKAWKDLKTQAGYLWDGLKKLWDQVKRLIDILNPANDSVGTTASNLEIFFDVIHLGLKVLGFFVTGITILLKGLNTIIETLSNVRKAFLSWYSDIKITINNIAGIFGSMIGWLMSRWDALSATAVYITRIISNAFYTIISPIRSAISYVDRLSGKVGDVIGKIPLVGKFVGGSGGGFATGTSYVPETGMYQLHKGEKVSPAGMSVSGGININLGGVTVTGEGDENRLVKKIKDSISQDLILAQKGLI